MYCSIYEVSIYSRWFWVGTIKYSCCGIRLNMGSCLIYKKKGSSSSGGGELVIVQPSTQTSSSVGMMFQIGSRTHVWDIGSLLDEALIIYSLRQISSGTDTLSYSSDNSSWTTITSISAGNASGGIKEVQNLRYIRYYNSGGYAIRNVAVAYLA